MSPSQARCYEKKVREGLCYDCKSPAEQGRRRCAAHAEVMRQRVLDNPNRRRNAENFKRDNPSYHAERQKARRKFARKFTNWVKEQPCMDCRIQYSSYVMEFDHRPGVEKRGDVCWLVRQGVSLAIIVEEIKKCDVVCANCHRERTHGKRAC